MPAHHVGHLGPFYFVLVGVPAGVEPRQFDAGHVETRSLVGQSRRRGRQRVNCHIFSASSHAETAPKTATQRASAARSCIVPRPDSLAPDGDVKISPRREPSQAIRRCASTGPDGGIAPVGCRRSLTTGPSAKVAVVRQAGRLRTGYHIAVPSSHILDEISSLRLASPGAVSYDSPLLSRPSQRSPPELASPLESMALTMP